MRPSPAPPSLAPPSPQDHPFWRLPEAPAVALEAVQQLEDALDAAEARPARARPRCCPLTVAACGPPVSPSALLTRCSV